MEETEKLKVQLEQERQALKQEEAVFNAEKKKIEDRLKEIDERLSQLDAQRRQIIPQVDPKVFSQYERILVNRDGLAIVKTTGNSCQGCNMLLPAQVINLIKMYERIITCEVCNRMLYIDEAT
jgi:predicted  nucleic acid-binding Zn-ribbon protein